MPQTGFFLDDPAWFGLYSVTPGCSAVGSAPRLGRGGRRFKSAHPDYLFNQSDGDSSMAKQRFDGVIESVRYTPEGLIDQVRLYERRGSAFSDRILLDRTALVERLKKGRRLVTGRRIPYLAGTFSVNLPVRLVRRSGKELILSGTDVAETDQLSGVLLF